MKEVAIGPSEEELKLALENTQRYKKWRTEVESLHQAWALREDEADKKQARMKGLVEELFASEEPLAKEAADMIEWLDSRVQELEEF